MGEGTYVYDRDKKGLGHDILVYTQFRGADYSGYKFINIEKAVNAVANRSFKLFFLLSSFIAETNK